MADIYSSGDNVVYPTHGVGCIEAIEEHVVGDARASFYRLRLLDTDTVVLIPTANAAAVGLRPTIQPGEVAALFTRLRDRDELGGGDWRGRFKKNTDRLRTGELSDLVDVLRSLAHARREHPLSYRERRMLDRARGLVAAEVATARDATTEIVEADIDQALDSDQPAS